MGKLAYYKGNGSFYEEIFNSPWKAEKEADVLKEGLGPLLKRYLDPGRGEQEKEAQSN